MAGDGPHGSVVDVVVGAAVVDVVLVDDVLLDVELVELMVVDVLLLVLDDDVVVVGSGVHVDEPAGADVPGGHAVHPVAAPVEKVSAGQVRQADAPSAGA